jgi:hypothetical protein
MKLQAPILKILRNIKSWASIAKKKLKLKLFKIIPLALLEEYKKTESIDYFLSGKFHFEESHLNIPNELLPRLYLTKNQWGPFLESTKEDKVFVPIHKNKKINGVITIAFFCSYARSHFFEKTIRSYAKINSNIKWILCKFADFPIEENETTMDLFIFKDVSSAKAFCDLNVDFIVDADGPLRPTITLELLKCTSSYVLNYYNLITTSNKQFYDALVVPKFVNIAPIVTEKKIIYLDVLGGWDLPPITYQINKFSKSYHFSIIAEQFKIGQEFLEGFSYLSFKFKFIFIGMKHERFLIIKLKAYGWNLSNIFFENHMPLPKLQNFLKDNVYTILDVPNYSSGSGTIIGLSIGIPTICTDGPFWINQMAASIMNQTMNSDYIYDETTSIESIIRNHMLNSFEFEIRIEKSARRSGYLNPKIFLNDLHVALLNSFS